MKKLPMVYMWLFILIILIIWIWIHIINKNNIDTLNNDSEYSKDIFYLNLTYLNNWLLQLKQESWDYIDILNNKKTLENVYNLLIQKQLDVPAKKWPLLNKYYLKKVNKDCFVYVFSFKDLPVSNFEPKNNFYRDNFWRKSDNIPLCSSRDNCYIIFTEKW